MQRVPGARSYFSSSLILMIAGWGGLALLIFAFQLPPLVWARWGLFALLFTALTGTALPVAYFLNLRFPSEPAIAPRGIVRQAMWVGLYGCIVAWLQLGRVMAFWIWIGLAAGLMALEYLVRLREKAQWRPPAEFARDAELDPMEDPEAEASVERDDRSQ